MIERYWLPEMKRVWSDENRIRLWVRVELAVAEAQAEMGMIPRDVPSGLKKSLENLDYAELLLCQEELERETGHDVIAFLMCLERIAGEPGRWLHYGLTSYDVVDTANALLLKEACELLIEETESLSGALKERALAHKLTPIMGRTHGVFAEPTSLGLKLLGFYAETLRNAERLRVARDAISFGKISGTVGNCSILGTELERRVMERLGLSPEPVSTQVIPRDRYAQLLCAIAIAGAGLERLATEIRLLSRTEVREMGEPFGRSQRGSSAMPHKRNPIICERICGLARLLRGYALAGLENIALWHERDISNSSAERLALPDATGLLFYMTRKMAEVVRGLEIDEERMKRNMEGFGDFYKSQLLLLALVRAGASRAEAYAWVKEASQRAMDEGVPLVEAALSHPEIAELLEEEGVIGALGHDYLSEVDGIFKRVMGEG
ncbi:MAG: adenylosuccinate lyase [candidate division WOR-3 bacterium]